MYIPTECVHRADAGLAVRAGVHEQRSVHDAGVPQAALRRRAHPYLPLCSRPHPVHLHENISKYSTHPSTPAPTLPKNSNINWIKRHLLLFLLLLLRWMSMPLTAASAGRSLRRRHVHPAGTEPILQRMAVGTRGSVGHALSCAVSAHNHKQSKWTQDCGFCELD